MKRYFILLVAQVMASVSMMAQVMDIVMKDGTVKSFPTKNITYMKMLNVDTNGHKYVDLGLSVYWATCNVGANAPEEYGGYFAWGETAEKSDFSEKTYKWYDTSTDTYTKYDSGIFDKDDDVAHVKWGGSWRMPTREEFEELCTQCSWTWTTLNSKKGYKVEGPNGNSIFMPAAGYYDGTTLRSIDGYGYYWSSSVLPYYEEQAFNLKFNSGDVRENSNYRRCGLSIRPVCP